MVFNFISYNLLKSIGRCEDEKMKLKYVGPKPLISHKGIEFDNNKEDKFVYLNIVLQLLKALDHEYIENRTYTYETDTARLSEDELMESLKHYCPNLDTLMDKEQHDVEEEIQHNIERAHENEVLSEADKEVLEKNLEMMHEYMLQRAVNKSVYYAAVEALGKLLKRGHVEYIIVPMYQKFLHVLHSVQGVLAKERPPIETKLDVYQKDGKLLAKLQVISFE